MNLRIGIDINCSRSTSDFELLLSPIFKSQIENSDDFEWTRQLRYNFDDIRDTVMIRQNNSVFEYGFEYLGSTSRLVVTPLTGE